MPYFFGRFFLRGGSDAEASLPPFAAALLGLGIYGVVESFTQVNVVAEGLGKSWKILDAGEGYRWGLKRTQGPTSHPIYFGLLVCLLLPWGLMAARRAGEAGRPGWWRYVPAAAAAGAFFTISRSAQLTLACVFGTDVFFRKPAWRLPLLTGAAAVGIAFAAFRDEVIEVLGHYAGESDAYGRPVLIYGVEYEYSGTKHRDLLAVAYKEAAERAGWFGYGTSEEAMEKRMPLDPEMDERFKSVDNQYLLHYLRYGAVGVATFLAFAACAGWNLAAEAWTDRGPAGELAAGLFGAFVGTALVLRGASLAEDFGGPWLFVAGVSARLRSVRLAAGRAA